jgi:hypothetical protein
LLTRKPSDALIEMGGVSALPPVWVDIYEETQEKLRKIHEISETISLCVSYNDKRSGRTEIGGEKN